MVLYIVHLPFPIPPQRGGVVPGRVELPTSTLSVWRSNQLSYRTGSKGPGARAACPEREATSASPFSLYHHDRTRQAARNASTPQTSSSTCGRRSRAPRTGASRKEVFQPHLPVRLPCYDLAPITSFTLDRSSQSSGTPGFHGLTGGVYKARERIHRAMADARLLANPASRSRVADSDPN